MTEDQDLEKYIVEFNKKDLLNWDKYMEIYWKERVYGQVFIFSEDLDLETLKNIFNGKELSFKKT